MRSSSSCRLLLLLASVDSALAFGAVAAGVDGAHAFGISAAAAFAASATSTVALHPLDTVKTRIQAGGSRSIPWLGDPGSGSSISGLYRGVSMNVLKEAPDTAVFLAISESLSHTLTLQYPWFASHLTLTLLLSGAVGDAIGSIFRLPAEVSRRIHSTRTTFETLQPPPVPNSYNHLSLPPSRSLAPLLSGQVLCKRLQTSTSTASWADHLAGTTRESWMTAWSAILIRDVRRLASIPLDLWTTARLASSARCARIRCARMHLANPVVGSTHRPPQVPMGGIQIAGYAIARTMLSAEGVAPNSFSDCTAGLLAGACAAALTTPFDVLVTHTATAHHSECPPEGCPLEGAATDTPGSAAAVAAPAPSPRTLLEMFAEPLHVGKRLVAEEGVGTLTKGIGCRIMYYAPAVGCFFGLYEYFRRVLEASFVGELANDLAAEIGPALLDGAEELLDAALASELLDGAGAVHSLLGERLAELVDYALTLC